MKGRQWTCHRITGGVVCKHVNEPSAKKCRRCGKPRVKKQTPHHLRGLDMTYDEYILLNGGEVCGICGRGPTSRRRLDRDHDHVTGKSRGLLCHRCNRVLASWMTTEWLQKALIYVSRTQEVPRA